MKDYLVIYEKAGEHYSAYAPDLPGCVACADTVEETEELMREAVGLYLEALAEDGVPLPEPSTMANTLTIPV